jgi:hypothetical protein
MSNRNTILNELIEETKHKLLFARLDCAVDKLRELGDAPGLSEDLAQNVKGYAAQLEPALDTLTKVERAFLRAFGFEEAA